MPVQAAAWNPQHHQQYSPLPLPSFMSVFGEDADMMESNEDGIESTSDHSPSINAKSAYTHLPVLSKHDGPYSLQSHHHHSPHHSPHHHQHRGSTSTSATESNESSPTTTISTTDSNSLTEPSPSSSPESPIEIVPLSSFASKYSGLPSTEELGLGVHPPPSPLTNWNTSPSSPGKKPRNTKGLSLNMGPVPKRQAPDAPPMVLRTSSAVEGMVASHPISAPPSPSFVVPPKPGPRRRPSKLGLTIQTPGLAPSAQDGNSKGLRIVPPTPSMKPHLLRHHQSSPSLSIMSPSGDGQGGMQLPSFNRPQSNLFHRPRQPGSLANQPILEPISTTSESPPPIVSQQLDGLREEDAEYDPPLSQEVKSPAYPSGPVCIYDPHVYLYLEPNEEEAYEFDVVINVAREVKNPFVAAEEKSITPVQSSLPSILDQSMSEPGTASTAASFQTALENQPTPTTASPTTPRAGAPRIKPEYIHMPWDHNTSIVDDLVILVETIDERVKQGKRVLIHCQCGVSRSASLIVAYGIYKNPSLTVQEAYDAVKERSRWIGPNMSLIYQLSEFRNKIVKKTAPSQSGFRSWRSGGNMRANTITNGSPTARPSLSLETYEVQRQEPHTAPLPGDRDRTPRSSPMGDEPPVVMSAKQLSPPSFSFGSVSPIDNISAPLDGPLISWPLPAKPFGTNQPERAEEKPAHRSLTTPFPPIPPEPPADTSMNRILRMSPSHPQLRRGSHIVSQTISVPGPSTSEPATPALLSPRTEFMANPFLPQIAAASSFGFSSDFGLPDNQLHPTTFLESDPRSPAQRGEAPIVRSIFDVL